MCKEVFFLSLSFRTKHFDAFQMAFSVNLGNYVHIPHIMVTTNLFGLRLFYVEIEHAGCDFESSQLGLSESCCQIMRIFYRFQINSF